MSIVFIAHHGQSCDLQNIRTLGFYIREICFLDTGTMVQCPLKLTRRLRLKKLWSSLGIPSNKRHVAGNAANFIMRALLMPQHIIQIVWTSAIRCRIFRRSLRLQSTNYRVVTGTERSKIERYGLLRESSKSHTIWST